MAGGAALTCHLFAFSVINVFLSSLYYARLYKAGKQGNEENYMFSHYSQLDSYIYGVLNVEKYDRKLLKHVVGVAVTWDLETRLW